MAKAFWFLCPHELTGQGGWQGIRTEWALRSLPMQPFHSSIIAAPCLHSCYFPRGIALCFICFFSAWLWCSWLSVPKESWWRPALCVLCCSSQNGLWGLTGERALHNKWWKNQYFKTDLDSRW